MEDKKKEDFDNAQHETKFDKLRATIEPIEFTKWDKYKYHNL